MFVTCLALGYGSELSQRQNISIILLYFMCSSRKWFLFVFFSSECGANCQGGDCDQLTKACISCNKGFYGTFCTDSMLLLLLITLSSFKYKNPSKTYA